MANNPYVNKVVKADGTTIIDISDTTAAAADVAVGKYFYTAAGAKVEGTNSGSYEDGDEMAYGSAGLAGTTWYFNTTPSVSAAATYALNFTSDSTQYASIKLQSGVVTIQYDLDVYAYVSFAGGWTNQAYRTISITGGTDATNADLIAWLQANATEVTA